jgi:PTH1 family peptidyl-tRNA hydrolase
MVFDAFEKSGIALNRQKKFKGIYCNIQNPGNTNEKLHFLEPETFMNLSGESVAAAATFFKLKIDEILVVHDELEIAPGVISLKNGGGLGGHNGLRSINANIGGAGFWRLRCGIGRPAHPDVAGYVLSNFDAAELETAIKPALEKSVELLTALFSTEPEELLPIWKKVGGTPTSLSPTSSASPPRRHPPPGQPPTRIE